MKDLSEAVSSLQALTSRVATIILRGKNVLAAYSPGKKRTMVQANSLGGTMQNIELLLPYGMSAMPVGLTADLLIFKINGLDHKVAIGADDPACRITDLQPGEFGFQDNQGQQVVFRRGGLVIKTPLNVTVISSETLTLQGEKVVLHGSAEVAIDAGGTGFVLTSSQITNYENGVPVTNSPPSPPQIPN